METRSDFCRMLIALFALYLTGCAGPTKPDVPTNLIPIGEGKARIIFTRENQVAGAGSPFVVVDIGEQIEPNAMIHMQGLTLQEVLTQENIASEQGALVNFLWVDRDKVKPLYCADNGPGCIVYHWRWPSDSAGGLLFGHGVQVMPNCLVATLTLIDDKFYSRLYRGEQLQSLVPVDQLCLKKFNFGDADKVLVYSYPAGSYYFMTGATRSSGYAAGGQYEILKSSILSQQDLERQIQVIGSTEVGETLIWDRNPGIMRLGSVWYDGIGFMPRNIMVEAGKTYYVHYTTRLGQRWELKEIR